MLRGSLFFLVALAGIALIAWRGVGEEEGSGPTTLEAVLIVGAVLLGAHAIRLLLYRLSGRDRPRR